MRKRNFTIVIILTIACLLFYDCRKEKSKSGSFTNYKTHIIPLELAEKIAQRIPPNYFKADNNTRTTDDFPILNRAINNYFTVDDENDSAALYVFNYANDSGFVVISAETWHQPVCAYVEQGQLAEYDSVPSMLVEWFGKTVDNIQLLRDGSYTDTATGKAAWYLLLQQTDLVSYNDQLKIAPIDPPPNDCNDGWTSTTVGPLLPVTWGQGCTYNDLCPSKDCNICFGSTSAWTGCVATAMAQVIRYWHPVTSYGYNYALMPNNQGNNEVQKLMRDAGTNVVMHYGCNGSSAHSNTIPAALIGSFFNPGFGFSSATYHSYGTGSYSTVVSNLDHGWPVFLGGCPSRKRVWLFFWKYDGCHEWICDGYHQISNYCYSYLYFHMNWGWHEVGLSTDYNGWFAFNSWSNGIGNFQYGQDYVYNVHL